MTKQPKTFYRRFDERIWPAPCNKMQELEYSLIHDAENVSPQDLKLAASVISAYRMLIWTSRDNRKHIVAEVRKGPNI